MGKGVRVSRKIISAILSFVIIVGVLPINTQEVHAASNGTADDIVSFAENCFGKSKGSLGLTGEWCARFVYYCAKQTGCGSFIGNNAYVGTLAEQTVNNYGGTIIFVNKAAYDSTKIRFNSSRVKYDPNYIPQKGDLYIQQGEDLGDQYFAHIGIVRKNSTNKSIIYTVEGNTTCDDGTHTHYNNVEYKTRDNTKMGFPYKFSAFIQPKYKIATYNIKYNPNGGTGSMSNQPVTYGTGVNLYKNNFTRVGYEFIGWNAQRSDGSWNSHGPNKEKWDWHTKAKLPPGWVIATWNDGGRISGKDATKDKEIINCYAQWRPITYTIRYNANGGTGSMDDQPITYGTGVNLYKNNFTREGYEFIGWKPQRVSDGRWNSHGPNKEKWDWCIEEELPSGWQIATWNDGGRISGKDAFIKGDIVNCYAQWKEVEHIWDEGVITEEAKCEVGGVRTYICKNCGETKIESIGATGHKWDNGKITKNVPCDEESEKTYTCNNCGKTRTEIIAATNHTWDSGKITKKVTCEEDGVKTYTCGNCGKTKTEKIVATGHSFDSGKITKKVTCEEDGVKTYTCSNCGETKTEKIAAIGHSWDGGTITTEATMAAEGEKTYTCTICKDTKTEVIPRIEIAGIPGDVNMDTKVNFQDVTTLLKHVKKKPLNKVDLKAVDVDGNGKVNFQDVTALLKYVKKKVNTIYYDEMEYSR